MIGRTLGHYRMLEEIGKGGMGVVYRAHDERLDRDVAVKVLPEGTLADEAARRRFRKEALALSKLNHPNIATVFDFDTQDGVDFLVMEHIVGLTLAEKLAGGPLAEREVLRLGAQLAEGLEAGHKAAIIHRDIKPGNVRVTPEGRAKILDFGLAQVARPTAEAGATTESLTEARAVAGTLPYMAPEQLRGEPVDARTDIYAAGVVLYETATGRRPFQESLSTAFTEAILHQSPVSPRALNGRVSADLERIILKCLEKDPEDRYQSAKELLVDLRRLATGTAGVAAPPRRSWLPFGPRPRLPAWSWPFVGVAAFLLLVGGVITIAVVAKRLSGTPPPQGTPSIAVLPFVDMSAEKNQEYFSDGLAEELLNQLAKVQGLRVTARTSSFQFKGKNEDLRVIGQKLNVATLLEGSVRKEGKRVRITAQLINVADGFHLWSETYDRELNDVFAVQDEIARSVAGSLKIALLGEKLPASRSTSPEAYNAFLQGRYFLDRQGKDDLEKAVNYFEQAVKLDSGYARAWAWLGLARWLQAGSGYLPLEEGYGKARPAVEQALRLDENLAEAHMVMGLIQKDHDWDWPAADASFQRALALEPGNARVLLGAGGLALTQGRPEEAVALARRAAELDPLNLPGHRLLAVFAYWAGHLEEAEATIRKALELDPEAPGAHSFLGRIYLAQGHPREALAEIEREKETVWRLFGLALAYHAQGRKKESDAALAELIEEYQTVSAVQIAEVYAFRGEADRAFEWLERSYTQRDPGLAWMKADPMLENLHRDPRFALFLKKMRLPT